MDQLDGVLGPFAEDVVEVEAECEAEPVDAVAVVTPQLAVIVWQFPQCCQPAVAAHCGWQQHALPFCEPEGLHCSQEQRWRHCHWCEQIFGATSQQSSNS